MHALPPTLHLQNSRVGQATVAIVEYIRKHQEHFLATTGTGVPERMLRWVAGAAGVCRPASVPARDVCAVCLPLPAYASCCRPQPASSRSSYPSCLKLTSAQTSQHTWPPTPLIPPVKCPLQPECRQAFGNNPDTSKALRFLVAENRTVRSGLGGRKDPYSYVVSERVSALAQAS